ncbi:hypothetical protein AVEN_194402-1 [Araneus ventricosus]|uniref:Uncharacterized protein n=1 Tax=Araneus ventricosus TaxID=182803 RepID=A0A4Y2A6U6_ARAVE|nr:hypothetical protein AVEN_194402-1 [Araneus ventricosus]
MVFLVNNVWLSKDVIWRSWSTTYGYQKTSYGAPGQQCMVIKRRHMAFLVNNVWLSKDALWRSGQQRMVIKTRHMAFLVNNVWLSNDVSGQ